MINAKMKNIKISNIEWSIDKEFHFGIENKKYIEALMENNKNFLPIKDSTINFNDHIWDFRPFYNMINDSSYSFSFSSVPESFMTLSKFYVLLSLLNSKLKPSTINRRFLDIKAFLIYLDEQNISHIQSVFQQTINEYMTRKLNSSIISRNMILVALLQLFEFIKANYSYSLSFNINFLKKKIKTNQKIIKKIQPNKKTPNIPQKYFNQLLSLLIKSMKDNNLDYNNRAIACIYIILSQTGLRIGEITSLEINSLKEIKLNNIDSRAYFLKYKSFKSAKKEQSYIINDIFANELTKEAFDTLLEIRKTSSNKDKTTILYLPPTKSFPARADYVSKKFYEFLYTYAPFSRGQNSPYPELKVKQNYGKTVFAPTTKQFRVKVCTDLYYNNVPLLYIQKYMNHLNDEMIAYYVRTKETEKDKAQESNELLKKIIKNEVEILGDNAEEIKSNINKYLKKTNLDVYKNLDEVMEKLKGELIIRTKRNGVCIKTSIRECAKDARTNEMFCAYDFCPNLFHLYYMADISYDDFKMTQKTFIYNKENGFELQASKELNKIKSICNKKLKPELKDLKIQIKNLSINEILRDYPNLKEIIQNYDNIEEEIELWINKRF